MRSRKLVPPTGLVMSSFARNWWQIAISRAKELDLAANRLQLPACTRYLRLTDGRQERGDHDGGKDSKNHDDGENFNQCECCSSHSASAAPRECEAWDRALWVVGVPPTRISDSMCPIHKGPRRQTEPRAFAPRLCVCVRRLWFTSSQSQRASGLPEVSRQ